MTYTEVLKIKEKKKIREQEEHKMFIDVAKLLSKKSHCVSYQVACLFVRDGRIISTGINGTVAGVPNCDEVFDKKHFTRGEHHDFSDKYEIHAEINGILYASKNGIALNGCVVYVTTQPCSKCLKALSSLGIKTIYFEESYDRCGYDMLDKTEMNMYNNIKLAQIKE